MAYTLRNITAQIEDLINHIRNNELDTSGIIGALDSILESSKTIQSRVNGNTEAYYFKKTGMSPDMIQQSELYDKLANLPVGVSEYITVESRDLLRATILIVKRLSKSPSNYRVRKISENCFSVVRLA